MVSVRINNKLTIPNYTIFRNDRINRLLGCNNDFECRRLTAFERDNLELLLVEVRMSSRNKILLGVFYRPPSSVVEPLEALADTLTIVSSYYYNICIVGDFNQLMSGILLIH